MPTSSSAANGALYAPSFWEATANGTVFGPTNHGPIPDLNEPIMGIASTPSGNGYWLVAADGGVFTFDGASFFGSAADLRLNKPIVGIASTPSGQGYWLVGADGGVFSFGDAQFFGSAVNVRLNDPIVGMAPTPSGHGYWLVAADGGVFSFGDATFSGSLATTALNSPIVGITSSANGRGYLLDGSDGGVFSFGDAGFFGATPASPGSVAGPVMLTPDGEGYWLASTLVVGCSAFGDASPCITASVATAPGEAPYAYPPAVGAAPDANGEGPL